MSRLIINSSKPIDGEVSVSGSKNSALPILSACLLTEGNVILSNVPDLSDIDAMIQILSSLGCKITFENSTVSANTKNIKNICLPYDLTGRIRASFLVAGPLLARFGHASVSLPGGCTIGTRPVDLHLKGFKSLGAKYTISDGKIDIECKSLKGARIYLDFPSVGATQNIMMAASLAEGETIIENCASEPEISDLADFINKCGGRITGAGSDKIIINGVKSLSGCSHTVIPDRIEAGTFMIAAVASGGKIRVKNINPAHLTSVSSKLTEIGAQIAEFGDELSIFSPKIKKSTDIKTMPYPGFPTDMQSQFASLLCLVGGTSVITETIFENRFMYVPELVRMNAKIKVDGRCAVINGNSDLVGAEVNATDLRSGAALAIAGICAKGKTIINNAEFLNRGYSDFCKKMSMLGVDIYQE
ncbi:MAG: UDP-N-acetylglucosamine 1-carboxyvinyltransferase [Clostridia bacterium]|nr:UDP-N-acetylglucosamine 1-carboxyvinyltransferase [Clostridia bacterium]